MTLYLSYYPLKNFNLQYESLIFGTLETEFPTYFVIAAITYAILALKWEGYYEHRLLQFSHYFVLVLISSIIPHGELLLHFGYRQRGYNTKKGVEEPFPDGFEIPKDLSDY